MRPEMRWVAAVLVCSTLVSCGGGGGGNPTCSFTDPAVLAQSPCPKFRCDLQNAGSVANAAIMTNPGKLRWAFPPLDQPAKGAFVASPVINASQDRIYIGSTDGGVYAVYIADGTRNTAFNFSITTPVTSTALLGVRDGGDAVFVGGGDGNLYAGNSNGIPLASFWPAAPGGYISASPTMVGDGSVYAVSLTGTVVGVCPNGIDRFVFSTGVSIQSSPAWDTDGTLYFGSDDHQLHAMRYDAIAIWNFSTSGPILAGPVFDVQTNSIYVADMTGRVYKVGSNGQPDSGFAFGPVGPISSSPAVAGNHLYFVSDDGNLYAVDKLTGHIDWALPTGNEIITSPVPASSPVVATNGSQPPVVVVGSRDGNVYFVQDNGTSATPLIPAFHIGSPVHSSPAIGSDGTVYIGADDGRLYAIGAPLS
jgi:outer membrane protein assembly factor BamB